VPATAVSNEATPEITATKASVSEE
jgi:hypothetical protein